MNIFNRVVNKLRFKQDNSVLNKFKNMFKLKSLSSKFILGFVVLFFIATAFFVVHGQMGTSTSSGPSLTKGLIAHYTLDARDYEEGTVNLILHDPDFKNIEPGSFVGNGNPRGNLSSNWGYHTYLQENINENSGAFFDQNEGYFKKGSIRIEQRPGGNAETQVFYRKVPINLDPNKTYTISVYCKSDNNRAKINLHVTNSDNVSSWVSSSPHPGNNKWERLTFTFSNITKINTLRLQLVGSNNTGTAYFSAIQLEEKSYASDFVDGARVDRVVDKSAYSNHGTNYGATPATDRHGREGGAMSFNGSGTVDGQTPGNNIAIPENITNTNNYPNGATYSFWINVNENAANRMSLFYGHGTIRHIEIYSSGKYFRTEAARQNGYSFGTGVFPDDVRGVWSHFTIVFANNETNRPVRWYQNGKLFHTGSMDGGTYPGTEYFSFSRIGRSTGSVPYPYAPSFDGLIDDVRIYDRALSEEEISLLYGSYAPKIKTSSINSGLIGHWTLSEEDYNHSTNRVTDKTPYENHGTNYGATPATDRHGREGGAMSFDGNSNRIQISYKNPVNQTSVVAWFKRNGSPAGGHHIIVGGSNVEISIPDSSGQIRTGVTTNTQGRRVFNSGSGLNDGNWHQVALTYDGSNLKSYIDGELTATNSVSGNLNGIASEIGRYLSNSYVANGSIDDVRIYDRALSEEEINLLYNSYSPKTGGDSLKKGLVLDMPLTSSSIKSGSAGSEILADMTPYGNDGQNFGSVIDTNYTTLNGNSSYIRINNSDSIHNKAFGLSNNFTISAWAYPISWANWATIINKANGGFFSNTLNGLWASNSPTGFACVMGSGVNNDPGGSVINTSYNPGLNKWSHVVCSADGNNLKIYVDGVYRGGVSISGLTHPRTELADPVVIGRRSVSSGPSFNGHISNIKVYDRALSEDEISLLYYQGAASLGGILTE